MVTSDDDAFAVDGSGDLFDLDLTDLANSVDLGDIGFSGTKRRGPDVRSRSRRLTLAATGATGAVTGSATLTVTPGLTLADFDTTDLDVEFAALIEAAAPANIFQQAPRPARGSLVDGELDLDSDGTAITRVSWNTSTSQLRLNDNDTAFDMNAFFASGGAGHDLTLRVQTTPDNAVEVNVEDVYTAGGNNAHVRFNVGSAMAALLNAVGDGNRFIIAAHRAEAGPDVDLAATGATGAVTGTATLTVTPPPGVDLAATGATGAVTGSAFLTVTPPAPPGQIDLAATGRNRRRHRHRHPHRHATRPGPRRKPRGHGQHRRRHWQGNAPGRGARPRRDARRHPNVSPSSMRRSSGPTFLRRRTGHR